MLLRKVKKLKDNDKKRFPGVVQCKYKDNTMVQEWWSEKEENWIRLLDWLSLNVKATLLTVHIKWKDKYKDLVS